MMIPAPRIRLDELVTEFLLHEDRKYLYVEGLEDCAVLKWYIEPLSDGRVGVFNIDTVEITAKELQNHGLSEGNRNRVIVLSLELDKCLPKKSSQVLCVVDADFDYLLDRVKENRFLAYTDGTSMDMYAFSEAALERVLRLGMRDAESKPSQIISTLYHVLKEIFLTRAANESLQLGLKWLRFETRCRMESDGTITFDSEKFIKDYLKNSGSYKKLKEFSQCRQVLSEKSLGSRRKWVRGHDFSVLLTRYFKKLGKTAVAKRIAQGEAVARMLFIALDREEMQSEPLFKRITEFLA